tara:strand:- start:979 stop:1146 length:168 start_codon:yes stop_codon:yes gene_type:complete
MDFEWFLIVQFLFIMFEGLIIYQLWKKVNWWEETYHKTKRAHSDIVKGLLHYGGQ